MDSARRLCEERETESSSLDVRSHRDATEAAKHGEIGFLFPASRQRSRSGHMQEPKKARKEILAHAQIRDLTIHDSEADVRN